MPINTGHLRLAISWHAMACVVGAIVAQVMAGCSATMTERELSRVAKDWCLTIRASQVIPVYPLTEDLQPGDVFLVQLPVHRQAELYRQRGFLPLDQMVARLDPYQDYLAFYKAGYFESDYKPDPHHSRPEPAPAATGAGTAPARKGRFASARVPAAQFPSYTFSINSGQGMRIAIPVQGIPVGLGLMNTDAATGTLTVRDAFTYGASGEMLLGHLRTWADREIVRHELKRIRVNATKPLYLRVVTRVYLVGSVTISLVNQRAGSGGLDVGAAQPISIATLTSDDESMTHLKENTKAYADALAVLNGALNQPGSSARNLMPGGSLRLTYASSRAISMDEDFDRLLVIGYLGFDVEILQNGTLGPPVSTYYRLDRSEFRPYSDKVVEPSAQFSNTFAAIAQAYEASKSDSNKVAVFDVMARRRGYADFVELLRGRDAFADKPEEVARMIEALRAGGIRVTQ